MPFLAVGVEHTSAPISIRECLALTGADLHAWIRDLSASPSLEEVAILSTCNRTEIYGFAQDAAAAAATCRSMLEQREPEAAPYIRTWPDMEAVEHLFRVASGLESQILGESQILAQVRDTLETGQQLSGIGANLHSLFRSAISCARQTRAGTALGAVDRSLGAEAVRAASEVLGSLQSRSVLVVGGGEVARLVLDELQRHHLQQLFIANRTISVAAELATRYGGKPGDLTHITALLPHMDAVFLATSASGYVLAQDHVSPETFLDRSTPLHLFDLAVPRDVDPAIGAMSGIHLHDLESLSPAGTREDRAQDIQAMETVIAAEVHEFAAWYLTRRVVPVIANLRSHVEAVSRQEMKRVEPHLADLTERERRAVDSLTQRLIDKMFHHLVMRLRLAAQTDPQLVEAAEFFFLHGEGGLFEHAALQEHQGERTPQ